MREGKCFCSLFQGFRFKTTCPSNFWVKSTVCIVQSLYKLYSSWKSLSWYARCWKIFIAVFKFVFISIVNAASNIAQQQKSYQWWKHNLKKIKRISLKMDESKSTNSGKIFVSLPIRPKISWSWPLWICIFSFCLPLNDKVSLA